MEPEAISSMRAKVKWQKISIYKCEKLLPFDVKNFLPFGYPLAKIQQTAVFLSFGNVYLLAFVLIAGGRSNSKTFSHQMAKVFHISTFALIEEMASALSPYREL